MKLYLYFITLFTLFIVCCSTKSNTSLNTSEIISQFDEVPIVDSTAYCIFDTPIHLDEEMAIRELCVAGVLKCDTLEYEDGEFKSVVVEFAGVKFGLNRFDREFFFVTSKQDKQTIDSLVSKISSYYGEPDKDDTEDPVYNYYVWNLFNEEPSYIPSNIPLIRIRPLHTEDGGLVMIWSWTGISH